MVSSISQEVISLRLVSDFVSTTAPLPMATTTSLTPALTPTQTPTPTRKVSTYIEITLMVNVQDYSSMKNVDDAIKSVVYNVSLNDRIVLMINEEESSDSTTVIDIYFVSLSNEYYPKATELAYYKISSMEMEFKGILRAATEIVS